MTKKSIRKDLVGKSRMPANSLFYNKIIPIVLGVLALTTLIFILISVGVLIGFVPFK
jgi:hypothetical protein